MYKRQLLVGSIDNVLRPKLVGSDTQLHELMIFFSTLGGLLTFGLPGFIIGPIIAALFVTVWEIYGVEFSDWLPKTNFVPHSEKVQQREKLRREQQALNDAGPGAAASQATVDNNADDSAAAKQAAGDDQSNNNKNNQATDLNYPAADNQSSDKDN